MANKFIIKNNQISAMCINGRWIVYIPPPKTKNTENKLNSANEQK